MKKALVTLFIVCCCSGIGFAQKKSALEQRIELINKVMTAQLNLSEVQSVQLEALNRDRIKKADIIASYFSNDPVTGKKKLAELEGNFEKKLFAMLTPKQVAVYEANWKEQPENQIALKTDK